jgi:prevent-host-death family protein
MTMVMKKETVSASEFKAKCLGLLDRVARTGRTLVVTKHGKAIAQVSPASTVARPSLKGSILKQEDLVSPIDSPWEAAK